MDFGKITFTPPGVTRLRQWLQGVLKDSAVPKSCETKFNASAIAYFASGLSTDGCHNVLRDSFHPMFFTARAGTGSSNLNDRKARTKLRDEARRLLFDLVSLKQFETISSINHTTCRLLCWTELMVERLWSLVWMVPQNQGSLSLPKISKPMSIFLPIFYLSSQACKRT